MKKKVMAAVLFGFLLVVIAAAMTVGGSAAETDIPDDVAVFHVDGHTVIVYPDGSGDHWCTGDCEPVECPTCERCPDPTPVPTKEPTETPEPSPSPEPTPTNEPTPEPTPEPKPTPTPCNRGRGNGPEFCDPGNSGGKPGNAGENEG